MSIGTVAIVWILAEKMREITEYEDLDNSGNYFVVSIGTVSFLWILLTILILIWSYRKMKNATEQASVICEAPSQLFKELSPMLVELVKAKLAFADRRRIKE